MRTDNVANIAGKIKSLESNITKEWATPRPRLLGLYRDENTPFHSCVLSGLTFEWKWGWSLPYFDKTLPFRIKSCCSHAN